MRDTAGLWAELAREVEHPSALEAYQTALRLMDQSVTISRSLELRHQRLLSGLNFRGWNTLAVDAASLAIEQGKLELAVEFVEHGRATLLNHMGRYRPSSIEALRRVDALLADEFCQLSATLEATLTSGATSPLSNNTTGDPMMRLVYVLSYGEPPLTLFQLPKVDERLERRDCEDPCIGRLWHVLETDWIFGPQGCCD